MADFGVNELNILASSGTPQIESVEQLNIRTGHSATGIGSTVVMGSKDSDFSSPSPSHVDTGNNVVLNVGVVTCNSIFGKVNGLTYPHQNGTDGYVLTSDGGGNVGWEVNPGGGSGAGTLNVNGSPSATTQYNLTFTQGSGNNKTVYVGTAITVHDNDIYAKSVHAIDPTDATTKKNHAILSFDGGLELIRNNHDNTAGGPYIDFTKNKTHPWDFDARIQLHSLNTDDAAIRFHTMRPGASLPGDIEKVQERFAVTRTGTVVSGIMTVGQGAVSAGSTDAYIQTGIGTYFMREADADQFVLTRDHRSKMMVFDIDVTTTSSFRINPNIFGYGDSISFYNASAIVNNLDVNGGNVRIWLAGTNVQAAAGVNDGLIHLSSHAMATLTYVHKNISVDEFVITGGGVYV
jgi:hypothetical protein